jgi:UDP-N-acetylglucosamine 1-carboxyvinyltransferase
MSIINNFFEMIKKTQPTQILIEGGRRLEGTIELQGDKTVAVHCLLATLFCPNTLFFIEKTPLCGDVISLIEWIKSNNLAKINIGKNILNIDITSFPDITDIRDINSIRSSICLLSPLVLSGKKIVFRKVGGCNFTDRPINRHIDLAMEFGIDIVEHDDYFEAIRTKDKKTIRFDCSINGLVSVGVTAHALISSLVFYGQLFFTNISIEPSIITLIEIVKNRFTVDVDFTSRTLKIDTSKPNKINHNKINLKIPSDYTVALTYIFSALSTGGKLSIVDEIYFPESFHELFREMNIDVVIKDNISIFSSEGLKNPQSVVCSPTPGIPTDCGPVLTAMLCQVDGKCTVQDTVYNFRDSHIIPLRQMGYEIDFRINTSYINGSKPNNHHLVLKASDIRAGAALLIAALSRNGKTTVQNVIEIHRGYTDIVQNLQRIGANIKELV